MYSLVDDIKRKREAEDDARWWRDNCSCKRQAWHSSVRSSSIQRDERDAPRSAQEPQQLETIDVVWHED